MIFRFAWRYFKAKKSTNAINIIARVSMAAIVVGTAALIIVLSVFNGLEDLVKSLYSSFYTSIKVVPAEGKFIRFTADQLKQLNGIQGIKGYSKVIEDKALIQAGQMLPVLLKGVDSNYRNVSGVPERVMHGKFDLGDADHPGAVLGSGVENSLGIETEKSILPLTVYVFKKTGAFEKGTETVSASDPQESVSTGNMAGAGSFVIQQDFDDKYVFTNLDFMQHMTGVAPGEYSAIEIALKDEKQTASIQKQLKQIFGPAYRVQSKYEQNQSLYGVMRTEKWVIYAVLTLILIVAAFNMVGALTMLVMEKQKDIQVLKAMGAHNGYIQRIFLTEGILIAFLGGIMGMLLAILICWMQVQFKLVPLQGGSFVIDYYPIKMIASDFVLVFFTVFIVSFFASWLPSRKAALQVIELRGAAE